MNDDLSRQSQELPIVVDASNPGLLEGLEVWLRLGLINDVQVKRLSQIYLTCLLPESVTVVSQESLHLPNFTETNFTFKQITPQNRQQIPTARQPRNLLTRILQGLKDELSVRWLLFLGLFLVVVSSTVLAATQWERFTNVGQYLVLFTYTLIFWGIGFWLSRKENLQLTSQTLQSIAFLLIPINFWAMDTFGLWEDKGGWGIIAIACITLTILYYQYSKSRYHLLIGINFLGLGYLNWGWHFSQVPLIAVYFALIITTIILRLLPSATRLREVEGRGLLIYGLAVLLIRAIFVVHLPLQQLGLAIGVCGWLLQSPTRVENEQNSSAISPLSKVWETVGIIFLFLGWLVSVGEQFPWQATIVSFLGLQFFGQRLRRDWLRLDLLAIFLIGLQGVFFIEQLIPIYIRQNIFDFWVDITESRTFPESIYSLIFFPYLLVFVGLTDWLHRLAKPKLAGFGEKLSLFLGVAMTAISLLNLTARSLNFFLGTFILIYVSSRRQPIRLAPIYFTHIVGLLTLFSIIDWQFSSLNQSAWTKILLVLMIVEWVISTFKKYASILTIQQGWYRSCWLIGFFFAFLSYILLWRQFALLFKTEKIYSDVLWWLLVPLTLTWVASRCRGKRRRQAAFSSCCALFLAQLLIFWQPAFRVFSLGFGALLMLFNTYYLRRLIAAQIQIGFTLALQSLWIGRLLTSSFEIFFISPEGIISDALTLVLLWLLNIHLKHRQGFFTNLYAGAAEGWAIFLCIFNLFSLTVDCLGATIGLFSLTWHSLVATFLIGAILIYRYWQNINYWVVYGVVWIIEILVIQSVVLTMDLFLPNVQDIAPFIAIINIILALFTVGFIRWLSARSSRLSDLTSLQGLPLIIAMMGIGWRWGHFTAYTGLLTLGAGITGVMVGYRLSRGKIISYLAVAGISLGSYEWAIYQMRQTQGEVANNIMILALITGIIALTYRLLAGFLSLRGHHQYLNLTLEEIKRIAHTHWGIGNILKIISIAISPQSQIHWIIFIASLLLPGYSLVQGRNSTSDFSSQNSIRAKDIWVYLGLLDITATAIFARLIWQQLQIFDSYQGLILCGFALILYYIPWQSWGWNVIPWQRVALLLPFLKVLVTLPNFTEYDYLNLLLIAAFYGVIYISTKNIRWTYLSLIFIDYSILHWLFSHSFTEALSYALVIGLSILYVAQVDGLKKPRQRKLRHYWRIVGSGVIGVTALIFYQETGLTPAIISFLTMLTGVGLQIRAFLFVGTTIFIMTGIYQLIVVSFQYSFVKWIMGLVAGIILITVAANFERRREQMLNMWQNWMDRLEQWQ